MSVSSADRNLLYGVLALQMGFVGRDGLIAALQAWIGAKAKPLSQILQEQHALGRADHPAVEYAVRRHLEKSEYNATHCLTALDLELQGSVRDLLRSVDDGELRRTLHDVEAEESRRSVGDLVETAASVRNEDPDVIDLQSLLEASAKREEPRYRALRLHARGGLGEVYVAIDKEIGREVALKEIRGEYAHDAKLRERFVREAEVNGNLEHPGIVPVYGLGEYRDGRPFYAMRFVDGETLQAALSRYHMDKGTENAEKQPVELRKLLRNIVMVCHAVAYAHSRSVLHRDIKPANILLGTYGETVIIDWGLAKLLNAPDISSSHVGGVEPVHLLSGESSLIPTIPGETLGSPQYMSPEQARGEHETLTTASDIYSLGATLYAVLTGQPPVTDKSVRAILGKVATGNFPPPTAVKPTVPKALEAICLKAMQLEPRDRYVSALALADDLDAWMADQAVSVYHDPLSTRVMRWARHHRTLVASGLALLVTGLAGLSISTALISAQKREVERARDLAQIAQARAETAQAEETKARILASDNLVVGLNMIEQLVTLGDRQLIARQPLAARRRFLESAVDYIRRYQRQHAGDVPVQARVAAIATRLANLDRLSGDYQKADELYAEATEILERLSTREGVSDTVGDQYAEALIEVAQAKIERGAVEDADAAIGKAVELASANFSKNPKSLPYQRTIARGYYMQGIAKLTSGESSAVDSLQESVDLLKPVADATLPSAPESAADNDPLPLFDQLQYAHALCQLGTAFRQAGALDEAEVMQRAALARLDDVHARFEGKSLDEIALFRGCTAARLAETLLEQADGHVKALEELTPAVTALDALVKQQPDAPKFSEFLADAMLLRARAYQRAGAIENAWADALAAIALIEPAVRNRPTPELQGLYAQTLLVQGDLAAIQPAPPPKRPQEYYEAARRAFDLALEVLPKNADLLRGRDACRARLAAQ